MGSFFRSNSTSITDGLPRERLPIYAHHLPPNTPSRCEFHLHHHQIYLTKIQIYSNISIYIQILLLNFIHIIFKHCTALTHTQTKTQYNFYKTQFFFNKFIKIILLINIFIITISFGTHKTNSKEIFPSYVGIMTLFL